MIKILIVYCFYLICKQQSFEDYYLRNFYLICNNFGFESNCKGNLFQIIFYSLKEYLMQYFELYYCDFGKSYLIGSMWEFCFLQSLYEFCIEKVFVYYFQDYFVLRYCCYLWILNFQYDLFLMSVCLWYYCRIFVYCYKYIVFWRGDVGDKNLLKEILGQYFVNVFCRCRFLVDQLLIVIVYLVCMYFKGFFLILICILK